MARCFSWYSFLMVIYSHLDFCDSNIMKFFSPIFLTTFFLYQDIFLKKSNHFHLY